MVVVFTSSMKTMISLLESKLKKPIIQSLRLDFGMIIRDQHDIEQLKIFNKKREFF